MSAWLFIQQETSSLLRRLRSGPGKWLMHFGRRKTLKLRGGEELCMLWPLLLLRNIWPTSTIYSDFLGKVHAFLYHTCH